MPHLNKNNINYKLQLLLCYFKGDNNFLKTLPIEIIHCICQFFSFQYFTLKYKIDLKVLTEISLRYYKYIDLLGFFKNYLIIWAKITKISKTGYIYFIDTDVGKISYITSLKNTSYNHFRKTIYLVDDKIFSLATVHQGAHIKINFIDLNNTALIHTKSIALDQCEYLLNFSINHQGLILDMRVSIGYSVGYNTAYYLRLVDLFNFEYLNIKQNQIKSLRWLLKKKKFTNYVPLKSNYIVNKFILNSNLKLIANNDLNICDKNDKIIKTFIKETESDFIRNIMLFRNKLIVIYYKAINEGHANYYIKGFSL